MLGYVSSTAIVCTPSRRLSNHDPVGFIGGRCADARGGGLEEAGRGYADSDQEFTPDSVCSFVTAGATLDRGALHPAFCLWRWLCAGHKRTAIADDRISDLEWQRHHN